MTFLAGIIASVVVSGLVVSTGPVPEAEKAEYLDWGANHVTVWQADEAYYWDGIPTTVWVDADGCGLTWQRTQNCQWDSTSAVHASTDEGTLDSVVRRQVGDEPSSVEAVPTVTEAEYTNFSYWAPLAHDQWPDLEMPGIMASYQGDHFTTSEYLIRDDAHWRVLEFFRGEAIEHDQTWGVYLNGYIGYETEFEADHTPAELREHAYGALAFGATEFVWFTYAFGPSGHEEATQGGGSIITDGIGWDRGPHWETTKGINLGLRYLGSHLGESQGISWSEDRIEGTFASGTLLVARTDAETEVDGWLIRPNGTSFEASGTVALTQGDTYLVADSPLDSLVMM